MLELSITVSVFAEMFSEPWYYIRIVTAVENAMAIKHNSVEVILQK